MTTKLYANGLLMKCKNGNDKHFSCVKLYPLRESDTLNRVFIFTESDCYGKTGARLRSQIAQRVTIILREPFLS